LHQHNPGIVDISKTHHEHIGTPDSKFMIVLRETTAILVIITYSFGEDARDARNAPRTSHFALVLNGAVDRRDVLHDHSIT